MSSDTDEHISMELVDMDLSMADIYGLSKKKEFYQTFSLTLQNFPLSLHFYNLYVWLYFLSWTVGYVRVLQLRRTIKALAGWE